MEGDSGGGVSVIIPAYRAQFTIARAVSSLLAQSFPHWQAVVVSDDGADYRAVLEAAGIADSRLTFTGTGRVGSGAPAARNAGLRCARMTLVAPLDADDRFEPERLARLAPLAQAQGAAADNVAVVRDGDGAPLSTLFPSGLFPSGLFPSGLFPSGTGTATLDAATFLETSVPMFFVVRRDIVPGWEEGVDFCDDVVFNIQVLDRVGRLPLVLEPLYEYRQREGSITCSADSGTRAELCYRHVLDRLAGDGLRIADAALRHRFAAALGAKRALNAAYMAAHAAGRCANFQEFLALRENSRPG
ncbi:glycosyltransferase involved in cell wall biosynthesis [Azospirillum brasilense]|uniref:Glycosyltransferase involved in cell wall biosynthesis n=1 Tax=Azospirillum brasilense TaxID=192 RepID=A0A560BNZ6_AZOBR|nr:glycosyltransferase family 2 protein [Azospirillum brasilense]TWA74344.1 glycosyltransferase involved in cell wall biosynthesis [Azospirillum brasilense]